MATPPFEWFQGARAIDMHDQIELLREASREIVTCPLRLRPIDHANGTLGSGPGKNGSQARQ